MGFRPSTIYDGKPIDLLHMGESGIWNMESGIWNFNSKFQSCVLTPDESLGFRNKTI